LTVFKLTGLELVFRVEGRGFKGKGIRVLGIGFTAKC
jgi:hypothetical protein